MATDATAQRAGQLDAIRAVCVLAVIFSHTITERYAVGGFQFFELGSYGVAMFFVLSAFLITSQLLSANVRRHEAGESASEPLAKFYVRRALRLLPAYFLALGVAAAVNLPGIREEFPWHALQLTNFYFGAHPDHENFSAAGHLWSLSMEWQYYLVWPFVVLFSGRRLLLAIILGTIAATTLIEVYDGLVPSIIITANLPSSLASLAIGALLAYGRFYDWNLAWISRAFWPVVAIFILGKSAYALGFGLIGDRLGPATSLALNLIFVFTVHFASKGITGWPALFLNDRRAQYLGVISYGIYLYHQFIIEGWVKANTALGLPEMKWGIRFTVCIAIVSIAVAALSWRFFEKPINDLRHRFQYRPRRSAPQGA